MAVRACIAGIALGVLTLGAGGFFLFDNASESAVATDAPSATFVPGGLLTETATLVDSANRGLGQSTSALDIATATDTTPPGAGTVAGGMLGLYTVGGPIPYGPSATYIGLAARTESAALSESSADTYTTSSAATELAALTEQSTRTYSTPAATSETAAALDSSLFTVATPAAGTESIAAADSQSALYLVTPAHTERILFADDNPPLSATLAGSALGLYTVAGPGPAGASATANFVTAVTEAATQTESSTRIILAPVNMAEAATAIEQSAAVYTGVVAATNTATSIESSTATNLVVQTLLEVALFANDNPPLSTTLAGSMLGLYTVAGPAPAGASATAIFVTALAEPATQTSSATGANVTPQFASDAVVASDQTTGIYVGAVTRVDASTSTEAATAINLGVMQTPVEVVLFADDNPRLSGTLGGSTLGRYTVGGPAPAGASATAIFVVDLTEAATQAESSTRTILTSAVASEAAARVDTSTGFVLVTTAWSDTAVALDSNTASVFGAVYGVLDSGDFRDGTPAMAGTLGSGLLGLYTVGGPAPVGATASLIAVGLAFDIAPSGDTSIGSLVPPSVMLEVATLRDDNPPGCTPLGGATLGLYTLAGPAPAGARAVVIAAAFYAVAQDEVATATDSSIADVPFNGGRVVDLSVVTDLVRGTRHAPVDATSPGVLLAHVPCEIPEATPANSCVIVHAEVDEEHETSSFLQPDTRLSMVRSDVRIVLVRDDCGPRATAALSGVSVSAAQGAIFISAVVVQDGTPLPQDCRITAVSANSIAAAVSVASIHAEGSSWE